MSQWGPPGPPQGPPPGQPPHGQPPLPPNYGPSNFGQPNYGQPAFPQQPPGYGPPGYPQRPGYSPEPEKSWFESNKPQVIAIALAVVAAIGFVIYKTRSPAVAQKEPEVEKKAKVEAPPEPVEKAPEKKPVEPVVAAVNEPDTVDWAAAPDAPADDAPLEVLAFADAAAISPSAGTSFGPAPGLRVVALGGKDHVEVWDLDKKQKVGEARLAGENIRSVALADPAVLFVWSLPAGIQRMNAQGESRSRLPIAAQPEQGADPDRGLAISPMGRYVALSRKGTRIYRTDDGTLSGVIPLPTGQTILAQGFHPKGKELYVVYQSIAAPRRFRVAIFDLATGQESKDSHKPRPGNLSASQIRGPLAIQFDGQNRMYLALSGRAVLNGEDGRLLSLVDDPPEFAVPLDQGRYWTGDGKSGPKVQETEFERLQKLVKNFESNKGASQVHPEEGVALKIEVGKTSGDKGALVARLEAAVKDRLAAEGIPVKSASDTRLEVLYNEHEEKLSSIRVQSGKGKPETRPAEGMAVLPEVEMRWHSDQVDRKQLWTRKFKLRASDVTCTPEQAQQAPAAAFAAAARDQALDLVSGYPIPYYISQAIVGGNEILPLQSSRLK